MIFHLSSIREKNIRRRTAQMGARPTRFLVSLMESAGCLAYDQYARSPNSVRGGAHKKQSGGDPIPLGQQLGSKKWGERSFSKPTTIHLFFATAAAATPLARNRPKISKSVSLFSSMHGPFSAAHSTGPVNSSSLDLFPAACCLSLCDFCSSCSCTDEWHKNKGMVVCALKMGLPSP